jgi:hypothetical protein
LLRLMATEAVLEQTASSSIGAWLSEAVRLQPGNLTGRILDVLHHLHPDALKAVLRLLRRRRMAHRDQAPLADIRLPNS